MTLLVKINVMNLALGLAQILAGVSANGIVEDAVPIVGMAALVIVKEHVLRIVGMIVLEIVKVLV